LPFTEPGAWQFIADLLDSGVDVSRIELRRPPGKVAFAIRTWLSDGKELYVKLQMGASCVIGRSFHYSAPTAGRNGDDDE
jgi:hypothetical protein